MKQITFSEEWSPLKENAIAELERQLGITLPLDYRRFLLTHNGGRPNPNVFPITGAKADNQGILNEFFGIRQGEYNNLYDYAQRFKDRVPTNLLPIARDPGGNLICLSIAGKDKGKVYFWDHEKEAEEGETPTYENVYFVANSFTELMNNLTTLAGS